MPTEQTVQYRLLTPAYIGGAGQEVHGFRPASYKGVLRFWWRAMVWADIRARCETDTDALQALHAAEARVFGSATDDRGGRQSSVLLSVSTASFQQSAGPTARPGLNYLRGQGLASRRALGVGTFGVRLTAKPASRAGDSALSESEWLSLLDAANLVGLVGGVGSGSRSGWGSVCVDGSDVDRLQTELQVLADRYRWRTASGEPPFSAFSALSRVDVSVPDGSSALDVLDSVGCAQMTFRQGPIGAESRDKPFVDDARMAAGVLAGKPPGRLPRRAVFGLPHSYRFAGEGGGRVSFDAGGERRTRRASPLFTHVHADGARYAAIQTVLPSRFLPEGDHVVVNRRYELEPNPDWGVLDGYLDSFEERVSVLEPRTEMAP